MTQILKTDFLVVGSGAGAVGVISELIKSRRKIVVIEKGKKGADWGKSIPERGKKIFRQNGNFPESREGIGYYRHLGIGGTVEVSCANGVRPPESYLSRLGIDIVDELDQVSRELCVVPLPETHMGENTKQLTQSAERLGLEMAPTPKLIDFEKCKMCAQCELMCIHGAVWSTLKKIVQFQECDNFTLLDNIEIEKIDRSGSKALAARATVNGQALVIEAENIILAAGGLGTPVILQNSGIAAGDNLHLDLYTVVYGRSVDFSKARDIPMATVYQHPDDSFILAPYIDIDIWYGLTQRGLSKWFGEAHTTGLMLKIADQGSGRVDAKGRVSKKVTAHDQKILDRGLDLAKRILLTSGASDNSITTTKPRGAHPGGTTAIGQVVDDDLKVKGFDNLFIADAGVLPVALGKPPILTIMALAKRLGKSLMTT